MFDRRTFLRLSSLAAAGCMSPPSSDPDATTPPDPRPQAPGDAWAGVANVDTTAFPMGVSSGDVLPDGAIVQALCTADTPVTLSYSLFDGSTWSDATDVPSAGVEGYHHVDLQGLPPDTWVAYQFHLPDGGSAIGRFRTAPDEDGTGEVNLGVCSCLFQGHGAFPALTKTAGRADLDAFVFLGDTAYFDGYRTPEEFRALYQRNLSAPGFLETRADTPCIFTWDDHEFDNNFDPKTIPRGLFDTAVQSWLESLPVRRDPSDPSKIWRRFRWGRTLELFVLDCRAERDNEAGQYVSPEQLQWLLDGVQNSPCTWKAIANSVPVIDFGLATWDIFENDRWEGFPEQRTQLLEGLKDVPGVVFLSGDVHCGILGRADREGPGARIFDIVCGPGGSFLNPLAAFLIDADQFYWGAGVHNATHLTFHHDGRLTGTWVGEDDQDWATFEIDDQGTLKALTWTDPLTGQTQSIG